MDKLSLGDILKIDKEEDEMAEAHKEKPRYTGSYNRLFPLKVSTNTFLTIYILHLLKTKGRLYGKEIINEIEENHSRL